MADLPALAETAARSSSYSSPRPRHRHRRRCVHRAWAAADSLRDLQGRAPSCRQPRRPRTGRTVSPHTFRHTAAVHLLEAGVEVNVIRGWLGHADLTTTNRYAEINTQTKQDALLSNRTSWTFGGTPHHANLAHRRDTAQLALLALTRYVPDPQSATPPTTMTTCPIILAAT